MVRRKLSRMSWSYPSIIMACIQQQICKPKSNKSCWQMICKQGPLYLRRISKLKIGMYQNLRYKYTLSNIKAAADRRANFSQGSSCRRNKSRFTSRDSLMKETVAGVSWKLSLIRETSCSRFFYVGFLGAVSHLEGGASRFVFCLLDLGLFCFSR